MKILNVHATHGPNYWSIKRQHLIVMQLDIEELETQPTNEINGFFHRLKKALPGLYDHHCSEDRQGGFFERVKRGTWMGHVIEHIALELQTLAGFNVGFGRTRGTGIEGQYYVVFDCVEEESGRITAEKAVNIAQNLIDGREVKIESEVKEIREMSRENMAGPSTASILQEAAARNIPFFQLEDSSSYQLGYGCFQKKIAATIASTTSQLAVETACDKKACKRLFKNMSIPVPEGEVIYSPEELPALAEKLGFPLVVKPVSGNQGRGVTTNIKTSDVALKAFSAASSISDGVIVERYVTGSDFRLLVINYKLAAAAKRTPAHVIGNGRSSIKELIDRVNSDSRRGEGHDKVLTKIEIGRSAKSILKNKQCTLKTVLPDGETLYLDHAANLSKGGTAEDATGDLHPEIIAMAERISKVVGLDICGIDIMASTLEQPLKTTGGVVLEVNAAPGFRMHQAPSKGEARNVAAPVLDMLFPEGSQSRIPIVAVTGTNGKTTTTRLISHILKAAGRRVGYTCTDGIYVNDQLMMKGDCGGPKSAQFILQDPTVDTAVLECARGGMLRSGLAFDQCDVGIVTNVTSDHLGMKGIDTLDKMARLKSVVPDSVNSEGYAVLNADDNRVFAMKESLSCKTVLFSMDAANPRLRSHRNADGICLVYQDQEIIIWDGSNSHNVEHINNIPLGFKGRAGFMIENILAAVAAAYVQNIDFAVIRDSLKNFVPSPEQTPGRMNIFNFTNYDVMIDYAHNAAGLLGIKNFIDNSTYSHKVGIVAAIGDRREEDNLKLGQLSAEIFDKVIIREDNDLRGKNPGELTEVLKKGIVNSPFKPEIKTIADEKQALLHAMKNAQQGTLIVLCTEKIAEILSLMRQMQNKHKLHKKSAIKKIQPAALPTVTKIMGTP